MTWTDRIKLAWMTFKREALVFYIMYIILMVIFFAIFIAIGVGMVAGILSTFPNALNGSISESMPVPGMPYSSGMDSLPGMFNSLGKSMGDFSALTPFVGPIIGIFFLVLIISLIVGACFQAGIVNLTFKAYREKVSFKDFKFTGFFRILGWTAVIFLINIIFLIICIIGAIGFSNSIASSVIFVSIFGLFVAGLAIFLAPWFTIVNTYLLAHHEKGFFAAIKASYSFFRRHMASLWGLIGTTLLFMVPCIVLSAASFDGLATIYSLVLSPFVSILAIVWFLSLEDEERNYTEAESVPPMVNSSATYPVKQAISITKPDYSPRDIDNPYTNDPKINVPLNESDTPKMSVLKIDPSITYSKDDPNFCPSCGRANTGTAYCPQCGTKL